MCTHLDCESADQLYDSYKDWATHEQNSHCSAWRCAAHPELDFLDKPSLEDHWLQMHGTSATPLDTKYAAWATETISTTLNRPCPVCFHEADTLEGLQIHLATHLQRIALFALPRSTDLEDTSAEGNASSRDANAGIQDSFQGDLESLASNQSGNTPGLEGESHNPLTIESIERIKDTPESAVKETRTNEFVLNLDSEKIPQDDGQDENAEAEKVARDVLKLNQETYGLENPKTLNSMRDLLIKLHYQAKYEEAVVIARQILDLNQKVLGIEHPDTFADMHELRYLLEKQGKYDKAEMIARQVLKLHEKEFSLEHLLR